MNNRRIGLAACGFIIALAAAGCGPSSAGSHSGAAGGSSATAAPSPSSTQPAWVKSLGSGVTVADSSSATAGDGSPAGVFLAVVKDTESGHYADMCSLSDPSQQAACKSQYASIPASALKSYMPTFKNFTTTYTAIDGDKALVGSTGSLCAPATTPSKCTTNTDPAAFFDSGKSFTSLWSKAVSANNNGYDLIPLVKVNGAWYLYSSS